MSGATNLHIRAALVVPTAPRRDDRVCYNCGEKGHLSYDCPHPRGRGRGRRSESRETDRGGRGRGRVPSANLAVAESSQGVQTIEATAAEISEWQQWRQLKTTTADSLDGPADRFRGNAMITTFGNFANYAHAGTGTQAQALACRNSHLDWIVDSGASRHVTGASSEFTSYIPHNHHESVQTADGTSQPIKGAGTVMCTSSITLSSVLHVPTFPVNLISVSSIVDQLDCRVIFDRDICLFQERMGKRLGTGVRRDGLWYLDRESSDAALATVCGGVKAETGPVRLFVGLPLDSVSDSNTVNQAKAISAGLRALKLLGAQGIELPIWWCITQPESMSDYGWSSYLALARMVQDVGLELRISLNLYGSKKCNPAFCLPKWVKKIAKENPDILFTDRAGQRHEDCLSFAVDELPVLDGKTPMQVFEEFFLSFRNAFSDLLGSTITDILVGLGPDGELRYPSFPPTTTAHPFTGVGEFQCYDKFMLSNLKNQAETSGNSYWGLSGPHNVPGYTESPYSSNFFMDNGGSWETPYGNFFLSWYSDQLLSHSDRFLSVASKAFSDLPLTLSAKVPLVHYWHKTRSHPAELTAGYYNTDSRDGYDSIAEIFAKNSCQMAVPGMDLVDKDQPEELQSSPELLLAQITRACKKHEVRMSGGNSALIGTKFGRIKENLSAVDTFTYQRMGADFFSPQHFPLFTEFVRSMSETKLDMDDLMSKDEEKVSMMIRDENGRVHGSIHDSSFIKN